MKCVNYKRYIFSPTNRYTQYYASHYNYTVAKRTTVLCICCWRNFNSSALRVILNPAIKDRTPSLESTLKPFVFKNVNSNKREDKLVHTSCEKTLHLFLKQRKLKQHWRNDRPHYTLPILRASNTACLQQAHANTRPRYQNAGRPADTRFPQPGRHCPYSYEHTGANQRWLVSQQRLEFPNNYTPKETQYSQTYRPTKMACNI